MKIQAYLILTVDYEVFGNGSGCIKNCVLKPAEKIMNIAENYDVPVTFFVDALEFIVMEKNPKTKEGVLKVKKQLQSAVLKGHDVQLHLHPQWEGACWDERKGWVVNMDKWRIGNLSYKEILELLQKSKYWIDELLKPVKPDYKCLAFRAGGWCIQPSGNVIKALRKIGIQIDSTVAPGVRNIIKREWFDFSSTPKKPYWKIKDDVCLECFNDINSLWEVPIVTNKISKWKHLNYLKKANDTKNNGFAPGCIGNYYDEKSKYKLIFIKLLKIAKLGYVMLDFCTMTYQIMIYITQNWINQFKKNYNIPLVAIGHTKNFTERSEYNLRKYLEWAKNEGFIFSTYKELLASLKKIS